MSSKADVLVAQGADAVQVMTENPNRLARDIRGIGFKTADAIAGKSAEHLSVEVSSLLRRVRRMRLKVVEIPTGFRDTDDGDVKLAVPAQGIEGREDHLVREIAARAKQHQRV